MDFTIIRKIIFILLITINAYGSELYTNHWAMGLKFTDYVNQNNININSDFISQDELHLIKQARGSGQEIYELKDSNNQILEVLLPLGEDIQICLTKNKNHTNYNFSLIPIGQNENIYFLDIALDNQSELQKKINNQSLIKTLLETMKNYELKISGQTNLSLIYTQKTIGGHTYGLPEIKMLRIKTKTRERTIVLGDNESGIIKIKKNIDKKPMAMRFNTNMNILDSDYDSTKFGMPLRNTMVTSHFSYGRYHPVLHIYRPHYGVDLRAKLRTPIMSIGDGVIIYSGYLGGYGNTIKIKHSNGYVSLYGHLDGFRLQDGDHVNKGDIIGYSGNTGTSSGPHLHLGIYRYDTPMDPLQIIGR